MKRYRISIDIGGTFVDAIQFDRETGSVQLAKAPTTPKRPVEGVVEAIKRLGTPLEETDVFVHGTTLGLNAILERRGVSTGIITNEGFRDLFEIGRADVPPAQMYDYAYQRPQAVVKRRHRFGVAGRLDAKGNEITPLDEAAVRAAAQALGEAGIEALAISFLHAYRNPEHELRAAEIVREAFPQIAVSASSEITREYREYERTATTVLDAYIRPIFERYIGELQQALADGGFTGRFLVMRSSGGAMTAEIAKRAPIFTVMSGPAGGIIGATQLARSLARPRLLTLDYGGTSLDASVIEDGQPLVMHEATLEHFPVLMPIFDIRCIGTGGGSIAWVQEGLLQVGPRSAGAVPGPIAYGKGGTEPTTTDAALVLGYLDAGAFLGGKLSLDADAALAGLKERVADPLGCDPTTAAAGIFDVLTAKTVGAVREITVERGKDLHEFALLAFGGAGPMIAPMIAREIGATELIVPNVPAAFSAFGMMMSDIVSDFSQTQLSPLDAASWPSVEAGFADLDVRGRERLAAQSVHAGSQLLERFLECRYFGQEHAIEVAIAAGDTIDAIAARFNALHEQRYGHSLSEPVQIVTLRLRATGQLEKPTLRKLDAASGPVDEARVATRDAFCFARRARAEFGVYARHKLAPGHVIDGPAIIDEGTSTTVVHSDQRVTIDDYGHLIIRSQSA
ncbi:hydantoinase/oxoprolinase family protein [Solimonas marina]|uniref:Hydantoinase/oxoprolinase family protein n=1 Tax=Solimonas marina TaxID=2714601 RepID=A0A969W906_9GAMM|nr:hydantoinase/oxoprolinase family protein [Solimonas marina]NKF22602.1 hydantoinase/oxoprolinase family protein [Solimonas marina]